MRTRRVGIFVSNFALFTIKPLLAGSEKEWLNVETVQNQKENLSNFFAIEIKDKSTLTMSFKA